MLCQIYNDPGIMIYVNRLPMDTIQLIICSYYILIIARPVNMYHNAMLMFSYRLFFFFFFFFLIFFIAYSTFVCTRGLKAVQDKTSSSIGPIIVI